MTEQAVSVGGEVGFCRVLALFLSTREVAQRERFGRAEYVVGPSEDLGISAGMGRPSSLRLGVGCLWRHAGVGEERGAALVLPVPRETLLGRLTWKMFSRVLIFVSLQRLVSYKW